QLMAMAIQKSVGNGGNQKLSVLLNPPELGRVQLDVEMGADSKLKVSMIAEKEAGFMQLQKDSGMLEQILQNAGLDVNEGDIDLSFASDGFLFDHQNQEELAELYMNTSGSEAVEGAEEEALETHVDLYQDPYSGAWHYNSLV
ncbi:MAG: flagellar hook-length control protein FliK, partial [Alphaproteobacteria bacterium]|nr:flagellar hook-length control protein FliK [Alphaproteobacteria bacterium]